MTARVRSFAPLIAPGARVLILGSMPGVASLEAHRYYAHPRNLFWPLLAEIVGFDANADYARRCSALLNAGIAVWDVLGECRRSGSLDSAIDRARERPNDLAALLRSHPSIRRVLLNGGKAAASLRRHHPHINIETITLPSTSPANASIDRARKLAAWRDAMLMANTPIPPGEATCG